MTGSKGRPAFCAYSSPSQTPIMQVDMSIWLTILVCCPHPAPPMCVMFIPINSKNDKQERKTSSGPPTMMLRRASRAPLWEKLGGGRPEQKSKRVDAMLLLAHVASADRSIECMHAHLARVLCWWCRLVRFETNRSRIQRRSTASWMCALEPAIRQASSGREVDMSMMMEPGARLRSKPVRPRITSSTSEGSPSMVNTTSLLRATWRL
jgi:hypothetical protein